MVCLLDDEVDGFSHATEYSLLQDLDSSNFHELIKLRLYVCTVIKYTFIFLFCPCKSRFKESYYSKCVRVKRNKAARYADWGGQKELSAQ